MTTTCAWSHDDAQDLFQRRDAGQHLGHAVVTKRLHALLASHPADLDSAGALDRESLDLLRHGHDLVQRESTSVAGLGAGRTVDRAVEGRQVCAVLPRE